MSFEAEVGLISNQWKDGVFLNSDYDRNADPSLLVLVRQGMLALVLIFVIIVMCICRHVASVHLWLEGAWWFTGTSLAIFLVVIGIVELISDKDSGGFTVTLHVIEQIELAIYLIFSFLAAMSRTKYARKLSCARTCFWISTIIMGIMWTISAVIEFMMSNLIVFSAVITMSATTITGLFMLADIFVLGWHKTDPNVTEEEARLAASRPFWERFSKKKAEGAVKARVDQDDDYAAIIGDAPPPYGSQEIVEAPVTDGTRSASIPLDWSTTGSAGVQTLTVKDLKKEVSHTDLPGARESLFEDERTKNGHL